MTTPFIFLPVQFHGQKSLVDTAHGVTEFDMTMQLTTHTHTQSQYNIVFNINICIMEKNGMFNKSAYRDIY